jgi:hypothetical protein
MINNFSFSRRTPPFKVRVAQHRALARLRQLLVVDQVV